MKHGKINLLFFVIVFATISSCGLGSKKPPGRDLHGSTNFGGAGDAQSGSAITKVTPVTDDERREPVIPSFQLAVPIECCQFLKSEIFLRQCVEMDPRACSTMSIQ